MPVRTINYTNRRRIRRRDVGITVRNNGSSEIEFDAELDLKEYGLPANARVFVEAYRRHQYSRFDFGRVDSIQSPQDRGLTQFGSADGLLFRVKVVESRGMLLAEADRIRLRGAEDEETTRESLLPVRSKELGDEIWRLEFEGQQTVLMVNEALGDWRAVARDDAFFSLVYPSVLRQVLFRILRVDNHRDSEEENNWRAHWLRFALDQPGVTEVPQSEDEDEDEEWVDSVARAFCRRNGIREIHNRYWKGGEQ